MSSSEQGLAAPDRWAINPQANVSGDAESAGMRLSVSIKDKYVRRNLKSFICTQYDFALSEAEQPWNIGELRWHDSRLLFHFQEIRIGIHGDRSARLALLDTYINPGNRLECCHVRCLVADKSIYERTLEGQCI